MASWEEKDEAVVFPLVRATTRALEFEGLTMEQRVPGVALDVTVETPDRPNSDSDPTHRESAISIA
jgi:hypothetical protein